MPIRCSSAERVARDQLIVVVAPSHPWAGRRDLGPAEMARGQWVLREPGSGTRSAFETALANLAPGAGPLRVALELPSNEAVRGAVEAGLGATAISASVAAPSLEAGLLVRLDLSPPRARLHRHPPRRTLPQPRRRGAAGAGGGVKGRRAPPLLHTGEGNGR